MIIRRKHTKNFLTLANDMVRDRRLTLDEHGMLHYLLSLPDDWEVSRANCARFWGIGREKASRIFRSLRKTGWAQVERLHAEDGTFLGTRWVIYDEPGQEVAEADIGDDDADEATGGEAGNVDQEVAAEDAAGAAVRPEGGVTAHHDTGQPRYGSAVIRVNRNTGKPYHGYIEDSTKTESQENIDSQIPPTPRRPAATDPPANFEPRAFSEMLDVWGDNPVLSRHACEKLWARLKGALQGDAIRLAPAYIADAKRAGRKVCDLKTFLRERRWERLGNQTNLQPTPIIEIKPYSPQWHRWREYRIAHGEPVSFMEGRARQGQHWWARSEWPPPIPEELRQRLRGDGASSQPTPQAALSGDDLQALSEI